jgi:hypothetical protein
MRNIIKIPQNDCYLGQKDLLNLVEEEITMEAMKAELIYAWPLFCNLVPENQRTNEYVFLSSNPSFAKFIRILKARFSDYPISSSRIVTAIN